MLVSGCLLLLDVAVTRLWQEPLSALMAAREQGALADDLTARAQQFDTTVSAGRQEGVADARRARAEPAGVRARAYAERLDAGGAVGRIMFPTLGDSFVFAEGTDAATLRKAPGHYPGSGLPGVRRPVAIAGHRTTYGAPFGELDDLQPGDRIEIEMPYGRFVYRVREQRIVDPDAVWVTERGTDRLVLTTCHPPFSAAQRLVIFADLVPEDG